MKNRIKEKIKEALIMLQIDLPKEGVFVEETKDISKGDFSTNIAMRLASVEKTDPLILAV